MSPYVWMLCGAVAFATMASLAGSLSQTFPWQWIAIGRSTVPFVVLSCVAVVARLKLPLVRPGILWVRSIAGSLSLVLTFYALTRLPASDVLTLTNVFPVWIVLVSWPMLGQRPSGSMWGCVTVALAGVVLILQPHFDEGNLATLAALAASVTTTVAMLGLHRLHALDTRGIVWHFSGVSLVFSGTASTLFEVRALGSEPVQLISWLTLLGVGVSALTGQYCLTKAFTLGQPSKVSVVGLSQVGIAVVFEMLFRGRAFDGLTLLGMALVLAPIGWLMSHPTRRVSDK